MTNASPRLTVQSSPRHGRGVFASKTFAAGEIVETCPMLVIPADDRPQVDATVLGGYYFEWDDGAGALPLGLGALYNHAVEPNAYAEIDTENETLSYIALRDIESGEEITISYGDESDLWFTPRADIT
jgi:uncharacterized protein